MDGNGMRRKRAAAGVVFFLCASSALAGEGGKVRARVEVHFDPKECREVAVREIDAAERFVRLALPRQCGDDVTSALVRAHKRGCEVTLLLPARAARSARGPARTLSSVGVEVKYTPPETPGWDVPFAIIDGETVLTGSAAWASRAGGGHESLLVILGAPVARKYQQEWERLVSLEPAPAAEFAPFAASRKARKFHRSDCRWAKRIAEANRVFFRAADEARRAGYEPCGVCRPEDHAPDEPEPDKPEPDKPEPGGAPKEARP